MFEEYIEKSKNEIIKETCNLINIPSISEETNNPDMPFGKYLELKILTVIVVTSNLEKEKNL